MAMDIDDDAVGEAEKGEMEGVEGDLRLDDTV